MRLQRRAALPGYEHETIAAAPEVDSAMAMVIECWRDLEGERPLAYGCVGFVPWRAITAWAAFHRVDRELTAMLITVIQRLDADRMEAEAAARALKGAGQ